jgi:hypothetical protein
MKSSASFILLCCFGFAINLRSASVSLFLARALLLTIYPARRSWQNGRADNGHSAVCRPRGLHKICFGACEKAFASQFHVKQQGSARVREFASWHEWFCRECESPDEERFGRAALSKALASPRFTSCVPVNVLEAMQAWSDGPFFGNSALLVHHYFRTREGGRHWTNCIGEGSNAALKSAQAGVKGIDGLSTMACCFLPLPSTQP